MKNIDIRKEQNPTNYQRGSTTFLSLRDEMERLMNEFNNFFVPRSLLEREFEDTLLPATNISEDDKQYKIELELPEMEEKDIKVTISEKMLEVKGEKKIEEKSEKKKYVRKEIYYGKYERVIVLPDYLDVSKAAASFKQGVLRITIAKKEDAKNKPRELLIEKSDK